MGSRKAEPAPADNAKLLARILRLEAEIGSIRQELVLGLGGPNAALATPFEGHGDELENVPGFVALEIPDGSGTVVNDPNVTPSDTHVKVTNQTGGPVTVTEGVTAPGVVSISIPDGESRGIKRNGNGPLRTEFVQYVWFDPICTPGTICLGQFHRYLIEKAADDGDGNSADNIAQSRIILGKTSSGGLQLTT